MPSSNPADVWRTRPSPRTVTDWQPRSPALRDMAPLRVRAHLGCAVAADPWLPLDSILSYYVHRLVLPPQIASQPGQGAVAASAGYTSASQSMPISRALGHLPAWYYRCSFAQWSLPVAEFNDHWNKRFDGGFTDLINFRGRRGKVIVESGQYRSYHMPLFVRHALFVEWYCVGKRDVLQFLLSHITHLGKKGAQGWGRVLEWEVVTMDDDWSVRGPDGQLMRAIPEVDARALGCAFETTGLYGLRPSYWDHANQREVALPAQALYAQSST